MKIKTKLLAIETLGLLLSEKLTIEMVKTSVEDKIIRVGLSPEIPSKSNSTGVILFDISSNPLFFSGTFLIN